MYYFYSEFYLFYLFVKSKGSYFDFAHGPFVELGVIGILGQFMGSKNVSVQSSALSALERLRRFRIQDLFKISIKIN